MSVMTGLDAWRYAGKAITVADMADMPDDGSRYELDEGMLVVSPAPFDNHQFVVTELVYLLRIACPPEFIVLAGPGINLSDTQHRVPDVAVVRAEDFRVARRFQTRPPVLAVEVASDSTRQYDSGRKKAIYEQFGIPSYWIVTPDADRPDLTVFELRRGAYVQVGYAAGDETFHASRPFAVSLTPSRLVSTDPLR